MQALSAFLSRLSPLVPACPEPLAYQALVDSARDFCTQTEVIEEYLPAATLEDGTAQYELDMVAGVELVRVKRVWLDGTQIPMLPAALRASQKNYDPGQSSGTPRYACVVERDMATVVPTPDANAEGMQLSVLAVTRPVLDARVVNDALLLDWGESIVHGAVSRLASNPNVPFSNLDQAMISGAKYMAGVSAARMERNRGRVAGHMTMRGPKFSGRRP